MSKKQARRAYSYIRFSTPQQLEGGSLTRQADLSKSYCERNNLVLDKSLTLLDLGVTGLRGDNVKEALAGFLEACRTGRVAKGSYLIVESLDRLSRDQIRPALQLFLALQDHGVTIVTMQPEREYPPEATDALALIEPLIVFARAHEESAMKSHRRRDGWKQAKDRARASGTPVMWTCPAWLEVTADGFRVKEVAATAVRRIFELCRGGLGAGRIAEQLEKEGVPPLKPLTRTGEPIKGRKRPDGTRGASPGDHWVVPTIHLILKSPAAMGTYQPLRLEGKKLVTDGPPIPNYYPAVVSAEEWQSVQAVRHRRGGGRGAGRRGKDEANLFQSLVRCAVTKYRMNFVGSMGRKVSGGQGTRKLYRYLAPIQENGVPLYRLTIDYAAFEEHVLRYLRELKPGDVAPRETNGAAAKRDAKRADLAGRLLDIDSRIQRAQDRARRADDFDTFLDLIEALRTERRQVSEQLAELEDEKTSEPSADLGEAQTIIDLLANATDEERGELRRRLKVRIQALVSEIWLLVRPTGVGRAPRDAHVQFFFRAGGAPRVTHFSHPVERYVEPLPPGTDLRVWQEQQPPRTRNGPR